MLRQFMTNLVSFPFCTISKNNQQHTKRSLRYLEYYVCTQREISIYRLKSLKRLSTHEIKRKKLRKKSNDDKQVKSLNQHLKSQWVETHFWLNNFLQCETEIWYWLRYRLKVWVMGFGIGAKTFFAETETLTFSYFLGEYKFS